MKTLVRAKLKKIHKNPWVIGSFVVVGASAYTVLFTDYLICNSCVVNENGIRIKQAELDYALSVRQSFYAFSKQNVAKEILEADALKDLRDKKRVQNYAKEKNIKVSEKEVDSLYQQRVSTEKSEQDLLSKVKEMYGISKAQFKYVLRDDLLKEKVQESLGIPLAEWLRK